MKMMSFRYCRYRTGAVRRFAERVSLLTLKQAQKAIADAIEMAEQEAGAELCMMFTQLLLAGMWKVSNSRGVVAVSGKRPGSDIHGYKKGDGMRPVP